MSHMTQPNTYLNQGMTQHPMLMNGGSQPHASQMPMTTIQTIPVTTNAAVTTQASLILVQDGKVCKDSCL